MTPNEARKLIVEVMELLHAKMTNASPGHVEFQTPDVEAMFQSMCDLEAFTIEQGTPHLYRALDSDGVSKWYPDMVGLIEEENLVGDEPFPVQIETMRFVSHQYAIIHGVATRFVDKSVYDDMMAELEAIDAPDLLPVTEEEPEPGALKAEIEFYAGTPPPFGKASEDAGLTGITDAMRGAETPVAIFQPAPVEPTLDDFLDLGGDEDFDKDEFDLDVEKDSPGGRFGNDEVVK